METPIKTTWQKRAAMIECFHLTNILLNNELWSIRKTSEALHRSVGSVSEDLRLSMALRIYPEVSEFKHRHEALSYLRERDKCRNYPCNEWSKKEIETIVSSLRQEINGA